MLTMLLSVCTRFISVCNLRLLPSIHRIVSLFVRYIFSWLTLLRPLIGNN